MGKRRSKDTGAAGFTLVELLVVIGIIALLVSILLPSLTKARKQAQNVQCMSNLKQIVGGAFIHAAEHRGYVPLVGNISVQLLPYDRNDPFYMAKALNDVGRQKYEYVIAPDIGNLRIAMPFMGAMQRYLGFPTPPTENWDTVEAELDSNRSVWKMFMCPMTNSSSYSTKLISGIKIPEKQATVMQMNINGSPIFIWSTNGDYVFNEGVTGFNSDPAYRYLGGKFSKGNYASSLVFMTDGQRRKTAPSSSFPGFADGWMTWSPKAATAANMTKPITLADALQVTSTGGGSQAGGGTSNTLCAPDNWQNFDAKRNSNKINIVFVDGHVETRTITAKDLRSVYLIPPR